jgi:tetratricopeptide (TPR) repeat protein
LLRIHPVGELFNERALTYAQAGDHDNAISDLTAAIDLNYRNADCYVNRGNSYFWIEDYEAALDDYNKAIELQPDLPQAYNSRANTFVRLDKYEEAISDFEQSIRADSSYPSPHYGLGALCIRIGDFQRALLHAARAQELLPHDGPANCLLGDVQAAVGDFRQAVRCYSDAVCADPQFVDGYLRLAWILSTCLDDSVRNGKQAVEFATKACELTGWKDYYGFDALAMACVECRKLGDAKRWQMAAVALAPADALDLAKARLERIEHQLNTPVHGTGDTIPRLL